MNTPELFGKSDSVKSLVFQILTKEYPLKLIELHNTIKRRYGKSVTYQGVRKAVTELIGESVLEAQGSVYALNPAWIEQTRRALEDIERDLQRGPRKARDHSSPEMHCCRKVRKFINSDI